MASSGIRLVQTLVLAVTVVAGALIFESAVQPGFYWLSAASLACFAWHLWSWSRASGTIANPYGFFLLSATLFNSGQTILELFGLNSMGILAGAFDEASLVKAAYLALLALVSLHLGALLAISGSVPAAGRSSDHRATCDATRWVGIGLISIAAIPVVVTLFEAVRTAQAGGYGALYERDARASFDGYVQFLAALLVPGVHFALAGSPKHRKIAVLAAVCLSVYSLALLSVGYRAMSVMPLLTFSWLWHLRIRRFKSKVAVCCVLAAVVVIFSAMPLMRLQTGADRTSAALIAQAVRGAGNPVVAVVSEMGGTLGTVVDTIELVPAERPFDLGMGYVYAATTLVPNLFWRLHPAIANGSYTEWLTHRVNPWVAQHGGSLGFSFIAESYANFGWLGTIPFMLALGYGIARFQRWALTTGNPAVIAALATFTSFLLFFARAESNTVIRPLVWFAAAPVGLVWLIARAGQRSRLGSSAGRIRRSVLGQARKTANGATGSCE